MTALASRAAELYQFQRTAQWIMPSENPAYTKEEKATFRENPALMRELKNEFDTGEGVRLEDGRLIELDLLVLATGFRADRFIRPMELIGRNGIKLEETRVSENVPFNIVVSPSHP